MHVAEIDILLLASLCWFCTYIWYFILNCCCKASIYTFTTLTFLANIFCLTWCLLLQTVMMSCTKKVDTDCADEEKDVLKTLQDRIDNGNFDSDQELKKNIIFLMGRRKGDSRKVKMEQLKTKLEDQEKKNENLKENFRREFSKLKTNYENEKKTYFEECKRDVRFWKQLYQTFHEQNEYLKEKIRELDMSLKRAEDDFDSAQLRLGALVATTATANNKTEDTSTENRPSKLTTRYKALYKTFLAEAYDELVEYDDGGAVTREMILRDIFLNSFRAASRIAAKHRSGVKSTLLNLIHLPFAPCSPEDFEKELESILQPRSDDVESRTSWHPVVDVVMQIIRDKQCSLNADDLEPLQKISIEECMSKITVPMPVVEMDGRDGSVSYAEMKQESGSPKQQQIDGRDGSLQLGGCEPENAIYNQQQATILREEQKRPGSIWNGKAVKAFLKECVEVAWYMNVQRPPMHIEYLENGPVSFDPKVHSIYDGKGQYVSKCVWPTLFVREGGEVAVKGKFTCTNEGTTV